MKDGTLAASVLLGKRQVVANASFNITTLDLDGLIAVDTSLGPVVAQLPPADTIRGGGKFFIFALNAGTTGNTVTVRVNPGDTYNDGQVADITLDQDRQLVDVYGREDATSWFIVGGVGGGGAATSTGITEVRAAGDGAVNIAALGPGSVIDGVTLAEGDLVLLDQDSVAATAGGVYVINNAAPATRVSDWDETADFVVGRLVSVKEGLYHEGRVYRLRDPVATLGVSDIRFSQVFDIGNGDDIYNYTDFMGTSSAANGFGGSSGGLGFTTGGTQSGTWGQVTFTTDVGTASAQIFTNSLQNYTPNSIGDLWLEQDARVEAFPTVADDYIFRFGQANSWFIATPSAGIYFSVSIASPNWRCITRDGGVEENNDSGIPVAAGGAGPGPRFSIRVAADRSFVDFFINRVRVSRNILNIPSAAGSSLANGMRMSRVAAADPRTCWVDWHLVHGKRVA